MIEESAVIKHIDGDIVWVETVRKSTCGSCQMKKGCGTGVLAQYFSKRSMSHIAIKNNLGLPSSIGDKIIVGMPEEALSKGSFMTYMAPLLGMFIGGIIAALFAGIQNDGIVFLGGVAGFMLGFGMARRFAMTIQANPKYQPVILRVML